MAARDSTNNSGQPVEESPKRKAGTTEDLHVAGNADQSMADLKRAAEKIKDAFRK
jgi:hypothetical protein